MKAIVVGAGLAGLSAAFTLKRAGFEVTILERTDHVGGRANTVSVNGYLIDTGASAMSTSYTSYLALAEQAGVRDQVDMASPYVGVVRNGRVFDLDSRRIQWSGLTTGLLSFRAKLGLIKLFRDVFGAQRKGMLNYNDLGKAAPLDVETATQYALREFSAEINDYFCDPVVRVMLLANGDKVSKVEFFSGVANILNTEMCGMRGGQQSFAKKLAEGIDVKYNVKVNSVSDSGTHVEVSWREGDSSMQVRTDVCVLATDVKTTTTICPDLAALLKPLADVIEYTRALSVSVGAGAIPASRAMTVLVPTCENKNIATVFLEHNKCPDRAPAGHSLFTAYHEATATEAMWSMSDEQIGAQTRSYVERLFPEVRGRIDMTHVHRWSLALPVMQVGGYREVARVNNQIDRRARIQIAGDYLSGAGQNTAVDYGVKAARNIIAHHSV